MSKNICVITNGYPTEKDPSYAFIRPVVSAMADKGYSCTVIAPQSITKNLLDKSKKRSYKWIDKTDKGNSITIYQPRFFSFSNLKIFGVQLSVLFRDNVITRCFNKEKVKADVLYAHFWDCGIAACKIAKQIQLPVYIATGESEIWVYNSYKAKVIKQFLPYIKGVISVSTKNLEESRKLELLAYNPKTIVLPNAVNKNVFYKIPQTDAREKLGIEKNDKVVAFVGSFCERKGVLRVVEAAEANKDIKLILIGGGEQIPVSEQIIYCGKVSHESVATYLNAADIFVLPTRAEGCCNAVIEALSCGLPIVSSDKDFNKDVLDETNSIMIDPDDINEISSAICKLAEDDELRKKLADGALRSAQELSIENRCEKIIRFMNL